MSVKRIIAIVMCALLVVTAVMVIIVVSQFAPMLSALMAKPENEPPVSSSQDHEDDGSSDNEDQQQGGSSDNEDQQGDSAHTHVFDQIKDEKKATCDTTGYVIRLCQCGETSWETTEAYGHSYGPGKLVSPTCSEDGYTEMKCTVCSKVTRQDSVAALGHDWQLVKTVKATCTESGYDEYCCKRANCEEKQGNTPYTKHENIQSPLGHDWDSGVVHEATCTEDGYTLYTCSHENCPVKTRTEEKVAATGHSWGSWTVVESASAGNLGLEKRECAGCDETEERHAETKVVKQETASEEGYQYTVKIQTKDEAVTIYTYTVETETEFSDIEFTFDEEVGLLVTFTAEQEQKVYTLALGDYSLSLDENGQQVDTSAVNPGA